MIMLFLTLWVTICQVNGIGLFADIQAMNYGSTSMNFRSSRLRRSLLGSDSSKLCQNQVDKNAEKKILSFSSPLRNDRNMDLQLLYLGENATTQVLLTTMTVSFVSFFMTQHKSSNLYQSTDGGRTFQRIMDRIGYSSIRRNNGIMKSTVDPSRVILVSYTPSSVWGIFSTYVHPEDSVLLISKNAGNNFTSVKLPFRLRENEPLLFHPKKRDWIIALEKRNKINIGVGKYSGQAWISKDFGKTWKEMMKGHIAASVKWGAASGREGKEIYLATHIEKSFFSLLTMSSTSTLTLWKSSDGGRFFEELIEHCYNFGIEGDFVFASVTFKESSSDIHQKRIMHVSKDDGNTFHQINVPEITADRFYAVLEMHKGMIFLHVDDSLHTGKGTLFISGSDGIMFTKSLDNHFYTDSGFTDFTRIESMHGVYITQVLQKDSTLKSVISFDRGVTWQSIYIDPKYCKNVIGSCTLHFHKDYSRMTQHVDVQPPLSSENAPGMIFMHGQVGDALTGSAQVWFSENGGYNWTKIADSPHHYAIGDNGNLLVIVPRINNTDNILLYSIDQGKCWHKYKFSDDNKEMVIRGLATEPHSKNRTFSLWGYFKDAPANEKEWNVVTLSFHDLFLRKCLDNDFVEWSPHILNKKRGCFLGEKLYFRKPKLVTNCYLGEDFEPFIRSFKCKCDRDDLECDYGYERQTDGTCKENKSIKPIRVCKNGEVMEVKFSKGYRRVPGDICESKESVGDVVKLLDDHSKCTPSKENVFGIIKDENTFIENEKKNPGHFNGNEKVENLFKTVVKSHRSKGHRYFIVIAVLVVIGIIIGGAWYGVKCIKRRRFQTTVLYQDDNDLLASLDTPYDSQPNSDHQFKEEDDDDDDALLPV